MKRYAAVRADGAIQFITAGGTGEKPPDKPGLTFYEVAANFDPANKIMQNGAFVSGVVSPPAWLAQGKARATRDRLLRSCDWTQGSDSPLEPRKRAEWAAYRRALRDITDQPGFPGAIQWPTPPG